ncbi:MAG: Lar family restriction alleviation protein, partial [Oscillospiraceae bacterium]
MNEELKLCPFCGSKYVSVIVPVETEYQVQCGNCYASSSIESTEKKAIKAWNRRPKSDHIVTVNKKADDNPPLTLEELRW